MSFNKGYELKKFEAHWEKLRIEYAVAGMTEEAVSSSIRNVPSLSGRRSSRLLRMKVPRKKHLP